MLTGAGAMLALGLALTPAAPAHAQMAQALLDTGIPFDLPATDRVTVLQRPHPETDPLGVRAGGFLLFPTIDVGLNGTSNVFGATTGADKDVFATVVPRIVARSIWGRNAVSAHVGGNLRRYADNSIKNENGYDIGVDGQLDVHGSWNFQGMLDADRLYINQFSGDFPQNAAASVPLDRQVAALRATYSVNRIQLIGDVNWTRLNFNDVRALDGTILDQDYQDRTATRLTGRAEYNVSPVTTVFLQGTYVAHKYLDRSIRDLTGDEIRVIGGAAFDLTPLIRTRLGAGYLTRRYDAAGLTNLAGLALEAQADYFLTQLTTISLAVKRDVRDAIIAGSPGYTSQRMALEVDHELLRNLILIARADRESDDFARIDRRDSLFHAGAGATYTINRNLLVRPMVDYYKRGSIGDQRGQRFIEVRGGINLTLRR